ncbi:Histamine H1 receptor [Holothuria leucospilota]|uniref:Histamine H1 receptor n=1 Tax=Holothuria leucospilota TaxID=206669 RepID=A0A9Q1CMJ0_HOLLE|nr:Histamine H1 receptor [Holothuria leucospilota]
MVYLMAITGVLTLIGNTVIILVYILYRDVRKSPSNIYIVNLAIADICVGVFVMLYYPFFYFVGPRKLTTVKVITIAIVHHWFVNMSVFLVIFMCVDRYQMVSNILRYRRKQTCERVVRIVIIGWTVCLVYSITINVLRYVTEDKITSDNGGFCTPSIWESYGKYTGWVTVLSFFVAFCIPLSLMVFFNAAVFRKLRLHSHWQEKLDPSDDETGQRDSYNVKNDQNGNSNTKDYLGSETPDAGETEYIKRNTSSSNEVDGKTENGIAVEGIINHGFDLCDEKTVDQNPDQIEGSSKIDEKTKEISSQTELALSAEKLKQNFDKSTVITQVASDVQRETLNVSFHDESFGNVTSERRVSTISYAYAIERRRKENKKLRKAAISLILFVLVYIICWLPFYLVSIATSFSDYSLNWIQAEQLTYMILLSNSCINPIIYPFMNARFRKGLKRFFKCQCDTRRRRSQNSRASDMSHVYNL